MPKTRGSSSTKVKKPRTAKNHPATEEIAVRAYHIYLERSGTPGNALEDWIRAERELLEEYRNPRRKATPKSMAA